MDALTKRFFKEFEFQNVNELINTPEERERLVAQSQQQQQQSQLQQIQLQTEQQMALQNNAQKAKMERDAQNAENKQHLVLMKGVVDAGVNAVGRSSGE